MNEFHERIIDISKKYRLAHLGSNLTSLDIIDEIYRVKRDDEPFILSSGHAGLALYVVLEKYYGLDAEKLYLKHGVHPYRDDKIYCSTGSLGMGLPIAVGMALAGKLRNVYCLISDGECYEGSMWEALNVVKRYDINNLKIYLNFNGLSAYSEVEYWMLRNIMLIAPNINVKYTSVEDFGFKGLEAHYKILC